MSITVVIPSYNHARYITQSIESVLSQDCPDIELIVIDDGSSDDSPRIIRDLLGDRTNCRCVVRENRGLMRTMNEGIAMAKGEFFCGLASDDYYLPGSLRVRAEYLARHPECVAVFADGYQVNDLGEVGESLISAKTRALFRAKDPIPRLIEGAAVPLHTMLVRTEIIRRIGGFDTRFQICEDLDIQTRLFLAGQVDLIDAKVSAYRCHEKNVSVTQNHQIYADWILCYLKYLNEMPELSPYRRLIRRRLTRKYRALGKYLNQVKRGSDLEERMFRSGWLYAWRDIHLLWRLIRWQFFCCLRHKQQ